MKRNSFSEFAFGISGFSVLIGLALLGFSVGSSLAHQTPLNEHMLMMPALVCIGSGSIYLLLLTILLNNDTSSS